jgi:WD40 repeat protein
MQNKLGITTGSGSIFVIDIESNTISTSPSPSHTTSQVCWESTENTRAVNRLSWNYFDNSLFAVACQDGTVKTYDLRQSKSLMTLNQRADAARDVQYDRYNNHLLASIYENGSWSLWDDRKPDCSVMKIAGHTGSGSVLAWHPYKPGLLATGTCQHLFHNLNLKLNTYKIIEFMRVLSKIII